MHQMKQFIVDWDINHTEEHTPSFLLSSEQNENVSEELPNSSEQYSNKTRERLDILIPGQSIESSSSSLKIVHLLSDTITDHTKNDPNDYQTPTNENYQLDRIVENHDRCFTISSILYPEECHELIESTEQIGYQDIDDEYVKEYRNSQRVLVKSKKLANLIWKRIIPFFKVSDIEKVKPYGFNNNGRWLPVRLNECMRFSKYSDQTFFKPHMDAQFVADENEKSIFTVLIYLNNSSYGPSLFKKVQLLKNLDTNDITVTFLKIGHVMPTKGTVAIFNHDLWHSGEMVNNETKYILRTEIIFQRIDSESIYRVPLCDNECFLTVKHLMDKSYELELQGNVKEATCKYIQALELHTQVSHSLSSNPSCRLSTMEQLIPEEVFSIIFNYLPTADLCRGILCVNRNINCYARNSIMWKQRYDATWNSIRYGWSEKVAEKTLQENSKIMFLQEILNGNSTMHFHDWYHAFVSRANMERYFCPVMVSIGTHSYRYGMANDHTFSSSRMLCGKPIHPHFSLDGYGLKDILTGRRAKIEYDYCKSAPLLSNNGIVSHEANFITFIKQLYWDDLGVALSEHPLLLCVPMTWNERHKRRIKQVLFGIGIPAVCIIDSAQALSLHYLEPNCIVLDFGVSGVKCVPVYEGEHQTQLSTFINQRQSIKSIITEMSSYTYYSYARSFLELCVLPPFSREENAVKYSEFVQQVEEYNLGSYYFRSDIDGIYRVELAEEYFEEIIYNLIPFFNKIVNMKDEEMRNRILRRIIVVGGFSHISGLHERLKSEILQVLPPHLGEQVEFIFQQKKTEDGYINVEKPFPKSYGMRTDKVSKRKFGHDMDVMFGCKIFTSLSNFRNLCDMNPSLLK
ncbi:hypothetical protein C9374_003586 [Naegleria lovaniensis]|uniref:F-box domain-containing protein n=1 Tax=Naegleria lovaniensis TaxID=51637 RepID=A0AA88H7U3_NAELO|nr:uncharacterized protein C9374_003586 [Naegleria lovaniensis]KAG2393822.1 hypothetical protein C9374_003586 [Naegleria lovaniensis]